MWPNLELLKNYLRIIFISYVLVILLFVIYFPNCYKYIKLIADIFPLSHTHSPVFQLKKWKTTRHFLFSLLFLISNKNIIFSAVFLSAIFTRAVKNRQKVELGVRNIDIWF